MAVMPADAHELIAVLLQVVDLLQNSMPLRYDDLSASQAFLKATMAVNDLTTDLHKHHGAVRDFMRELLSSVWCCLIPMESMYTLTSGAAYAEATITAQSLVRPDLTPSCMPPLQHLQKTSSQLSPLYPQT